MANGMAALVHAVSDDPEVKAAAKNLVLDAINDARFLMQVGSPEIRSRLTAALLPTALASMKGQGEDESTVELRAQMDALIVEMRET